jgi:hypothetical protein
MLSSIHTQRKSAVQVQVSVKEAKSYLLPIYKAYQVVPLDNV